MKYIWNIWMNIIILIKRTAGCNVGGKWKKNFFLYFAIHQEYVAIKPIFWISVSYWEPQGCQKSQRTHRLHSYRTRPAGQSMREFTYSIHAIDLIGLTAFIPFSLWYKLEVAQNILSADDEMRAVCKLNLSCN